MLRLMLDAHTELCIPPETAFLPRAVTLLPDEAQARAAFYQLVTGHKTWGDFGLDPVRFREALTDI